MSVLLAALANTARDLGVGLLIALAVFACLVLIGVFLGRFIHGPETPVFVAPDEPKDAGDLDDWLSDSEPFFEFNLWECPESSVQVGRRA